MELDASRQHLIRCHPAPLTPLAHSVTVKAGAGGLGTAALVAAIGEARKLSEAVRGALDSLPAGGLGWVAAEVLATAVAVMLWRRWDDACKVREALWRRLALYALGGDGRAARPPHLRRQPDAGRARRGEGPADRANHQRCVGAS